MKPKFNKVLEQCIETGLNLGYSRAFKHSDTPDETAIKSKQLDAILEEIYEWFDTENTYED